MKHGQWRLLIFLFFLFLFFGFVFFCFFLVCLSNIKKNTLVILIVLNSKWCELLFIRVLSEETVMKALLCTDVQIKFRVEVLM